MWACICEGEWILAPVSVLSGEGCIISEGNCWVEKMKQVLLCLVLLSIIQHLSAGAASTERALLHVNCLAGA